MQETSKTVTPWACILPIAVLIGLTACGGGGGGSSTTTTGDNSKSYTLPSEISAVPASSSTTTASPAAVRSLSGAFKSINQLAKAVVPADLAPTSDYHAEKSSRYVEEPSLEIFDIFGTIFKAVAQTNYSDASVVDQGPYRAMVSWEETSEESGVASKTMQEWVIDSQLATDATFGVYNLVHVWITEIDHGIEREIKVEFKIFEGANINADGEAISMGSWDIYADFGSMNSTANYFFAQARTDADDVSTLYMKEIGQDRGGNASVPDTKAVLVRSNAVGHGKVQVPDWEACWKNNSIAVECAPDTNNMPTIIPQANVQYAYNADYLGIRKPGAATNGSEDEFKFRNLNEGVLLVHRYGLYHANGANAGDNVLKHKQFGFPVQKDITGSNGTYTQYGYYGAWQGRHQLWGFEGANLAVDDAVVKEVYSGGTPSQVTYTVGKITDGIVVKRSLVDATLADIQGIVADTWFNKFANLRYNAAASDFKLCDGFVDMDFSAQPPTPTCNGSPTGFSNFTGSKLETLLNEATVNGYTVRIFGQGGSVTYNPGTGFSGPYNDGDNINVEVNGRIFVKYVGFDTNNGGSTTGFVRLSQSTNPVTGAVDYTASAPTTYTPSRRDPLFINANGSNFIVNVLSDTPTTTAHYNVRMELQSAANPVNAATFIPSDTRSGMGTAATYLAYPWDKTKKYLFDSTNLVVTDDANTPATLTQDTWGLHVFSDSGTANISSDDVMLTATGNAVLVDVNGMPDFNATGFVEPAQFSWEYAGTGQNRQPWKSMTFLKDASSNWVILDAPIHMDGTALVDSAGNSNGTSSALVYEGFLHGLPDIYRELSENNWTLTMDMRAKVVHIPEGAELTDSSDSTVKYLIKPMDSSIFLGIDKVNTTLWPSVSAADSINLADIDALVPSPAPNIGTKPSDTDAAIMFVEGDAVQ